MNSKYILQLLQKIEKNKSITKDDAFFVLGLEKFFLPDLFFVASSVRRKFFDNKIATCSIINAKSGKCSEDCKYCAQSSHFNTKINTYNLKSREYILQKAVEENSISLRFSIVTSGKKPTKTELKEIGKAIESFKSFGITQKPCASLGLLSKDDLLSLKQKGLTRFHHNLETSRRYFPNICTTHSFEDKINTIQNAKDVGLELCVGGIFGMGETIEDRIDLLFEIKNVNPDAIPINFLNSMPGTPLEGIPSIETWEALKIITLARLILPNKFIKIGAGRLEVFKDNQSLPFLAGANGMIVGNLLTTKGRKPQEDLNLIESMGFVVNDF